LRIEKAGSAMVATAHAMWCIAMVVGGNLIWQVAPAVGGAAHMDV